MGAIGWRLRRLRRMSPAEIAGRLRDLCVKQLWRHGRFRPRGPLAKTAPFRFVLPPPDGLPHGIGVEARRRLLTEADRILAGEVTVLGRTSTLLGAEPDWFTDIRTGRQAPETAYFADIDHRDPASVGEVKYVWEPSRHHHLTLLAAAFYVSGHPAYAERVGAHLTSWWARNPFLQGVHWTSGIEVGMRLISWVWLRRLLDDWPGVGALFDRNPVFLDQLHAHQAYLAALPSHGSSANNHLVAELAGLFAASTACPVFPESARWRAEAAAAITREIRRQTFPDGLNRELATAYHGFTFELFLAAAVEDAGQGAGDRLLQDSAWEGLAAMADALASTVDGGGRPPRQGDDDGGVALLLDGAPFDRWRSLLATSELLFGRAEWWPHLPPANDVRTALLASVAGRHPVVPRPREHGAGRTSHFVEGGMVLLRDLDQRPDQLWARLDHGPLGFLAIAAHGHADALSIELRHGGVDILADPGTYCYHGQDRWRAYFRSTRAHNTLELDGRDQSSSGGLFLWLDQPHSVLESVSGLEDGDLAEWAASHDGYRRLSPPAIHRRQVRLDRSRREVRIVDTVVSSAAHAACLAFTLGPQVSCVLEGDAAELRWRAAGRLWRGTLRLPPVLRWTLHRGEEEPILGWYSAAFGQREPTFMLLGEGQVAGEALETSLVIVEDAGG